MTEIDWETKVNRNEAAALLRRIADGLEGGKKVKLDHGGLELKLGVADEVELEIEVELDDGETEVEIELKWSTGGGGRPEAEGEAAAGSVRSGDAGAGAGDESGAEDTPTGALPPPD